MMKEVECNKCGIKKPLTEEFFYKRSDTSYGFRRYCIECKQIHEKKYNDADREAARSRCRSHYRRNKQQYIDRSNKTDNRIKGNLRTRIHNALKGKSKSSSTTKLLGCSIEYFKSYLQAKFTDGMSWDNYGKWHIDHILPCASFDLTKKEEQRKCFHYTNLQPLWAKDNLSKGCKIL